MENTQEQNETLKPEQMESGKWYLVETRFKFLSKFKELFENRILEYKGYSYYSDRINSDIPLTHIDDIKSIRHATKEEVLKYFPDEVFEPIELRPEDLLSGEVYTFITNNGYKYTLKFNIIVDDKNLMYFKIFMYQSSAYYINGKFNYLFTKIYHATPEEKALLLGEEALIDWEAKYNQLQGVHQNLERQYRELKESYTNSYNELQDKYEKLSAYNDELTERINKTETKNNQEKVYFYLEDMSLGWTFDRNKDSAINLSQSNYNIYEAVKIGVKKSVLVNENS